MSHSNFKNEIKGKTLSNLLIVFLLVFLSSCNNNNYKEVPAQKKMTLNDSIKRGEYLVKTIGCHDCHSPKAMTERGPTEIAELALSGYQAGDSLPPMNTEALQSGWMLMNRSAHRLRRTLGRFFLF